MFLYKKTLCLLDRVELTLFFRDVPGLIKHSYLSTTLDIVLFLHANFKNVKLDPLIPAS